MSDVKAFVFDVGGVFRDSSKALHFSYKKAFEKHRLEFPFSVRETWLLQGFDEFNNFYQIHRTLLAVLRGKANVSEILENEDPVKETLKIIEKNVFGKDEGMLKDMEDYAFKIFATEESKKMIRVYDGVKEGIKLLNSRKFPMGVVSVAKRDLNVKWLKDHIGDYFNPVLGSDEFTTKVEGIKECCEAFRLNPENVAMVGDSITDLRNGRKVGCKTVALLCGMGMEKFLRNESPDYVFKDVLEVAKYFCK
ncbi:MAG: HAD-IA family hydrolase [Candidatus Aenigmarchaeota archaeon]|nr:HAD-IA family hydrolase [Candidatus Aenigmarchaeota archaeon]NIS73143.1 HAD-IA family hydrolase [Candidatus Aenigmarchaeota archaeon]